MSSQERVRSVDRAVDILDVLAESMGGETVTAVAVAVGGSKSAVFTTLQTLCARGLVRSTGAGVDRRYALGLRLTYLGEQALSRVSIREAAMPFLRRLTVATGLTSRVVTRAENYAVAVGRVDNLEGVRFELHMGQREYLHSTSVGKAILSALTNQEIRRTMAAVPMIRRTSRTILDLDALVDEIELTRRRGWAIDDEEDAEGVVCVGAVVRDHSGRPAGGISVTRLKSGLSPSASERIGGLVAACAADVSFAMGHVAADRFGSPEHELPGPARN